MKNKYFIKKEEVYCPNCKKPELKNVYIGTPHQKAYHKMLFVEEVLGCPWCKKIFLKKELNK